MQSIGQVKMSDTGNHAPRSMGSVQMLITINKNVNQSVDKVVQAFSRLENLIRNLYVRNNRWTLS